MGSTSIPGLPAKPAIDLDVVVRWPLELDKATERFVALGYTHRAHLKMQDRRALKRSGTTHNVYVCLSDGVSLLNHLTFRDHLRTHPADAAVYATLKKELARNFQNDKCRYIKGKTDFILSILEQRFPNFLSQFLWVKRFLDQGQVPLRQQLIFHQRIHFTGLSPAVEPTVHPKVRRKLQPDSVPKTTHVNRINE